MSAALQLLLKQRRDGEQQQVASTLHKYLHIGKRADARRPGEIYRLKAEEKRLSRLSERANMLQPPVSSHETRSNKNQLLVRG